MSADASRREGGASPLIRAVGGARWGRSHSSEAVKGIGGGLISALFSQFVKMKRGKVQIFPTNFISG